MIEATCSACGTLNRVAEANVPVGAKFITCADCKSRVAIPLPAAPAPPPVPAAGVRPPPIAAAPVGGPTMKPTGVIDLADLPAPKRASALGPVPPPITRPTVPMKSPVRSAMRSGLAAALDPELPAPKAMRSTGTIPTASLDLDEVPGTAAPEDGGIDLPAPKRTAQRPAVEPAREDVADLPAPKVTRGVADLPAPKLVPRRAVPDLPVPKDEDLPLYKDVAMRPPIADLPAPKKGPTIPDLPTPRVTEGSARGIDLPAPKGFFDDLPQPALDQGPGLPAPKGFFDDLPQPALDRPGLPAPKGFFDDLPQPKSKPSAGPPEVPAPKGYFENIPDLPHTSKPELPAPKGYFENVPGLPHTSKPELPAPKGYFENIPDLPHSSKPEVPAPKGYFENIPGLPHTSKPEAPAPKGYFENIPDLPHTSKPEAPAPKGYFENIPDLPHNHKPEVPAPKGYFDDIPGLPHIAKPEPPAPKGFFDDIPGRPLKKSEELAPRGFFEDLPPAAAAARSDSGPGGRTPANADLQLQTGPELELMPPSSEGGSSFDDLDLSKPSAPPIRFEHAARVAAPRAPAGAPFATQDSGIALEIEGATPTTAKPRLVAKPTVKDKPILDEVAAAHARSRRTRLALGGVVAALALGGGGFGLYQRHEAAKQRDAEIAEQLAIARAAYAAGDPRHWQRAAAAARHVVELDPRNPEALGLGAEALFASALADGTAAAAKITQARALLDAANGAGLSSPQLARARALAQLAAHQPDGALTQLQPLATQAPKDATLALYLGWALDAKGDPAAAVQAYDRATTGAQVKLDALYGRGSARLELADLEGARADFSAVLELAKDHIGAQVGLAAAQPPSAAQQQEADLVAILARRDLPAADPRAVAQAWTRAGDAAMRAGRYDVARDRFHKALGVVPQDLAATTGLADTELRDGKLTVAAELLAAELTVAKDNVPAQLVQSEIEVMQRKLPLARQRLAALAAHATPLPPLEQARLHLVTGKLLEAQGKDDEAVDEYALGAKAARDLDLTPMMAAVDKLALMITAADHAKDARRADELRARSDQLLGELAVEAERDPRLAQRLGMAYLQGGNADKAEPWLRRAVEARPGDAEARFQLGRALFKADKNDDALEALSAALGLDPGRADIGVAVARTYEALRRDRDADKLYTKLLAAKEPSLELRARAGRFFARIGALDRAGEQGAQIVAADATNAAGLYLKGEGLLAAGKLVEAKQTFQRAVELDRDPQYLDALGRAAEALCQTSGDRELQDLALRSYLSAAEAAPTMFNPLAGQGRLYVARHEAAKAVTPLLAAIKLDSKNAEVMFLIGAAYQELQQTATALQWLEASAKIAPRADAFWRIGQIYRDANQGPPARAAVASATRLAAEAEKRTGKPVAWLTDALYLQGRVNLDLHDEAAARDAWVRYVARNPPVSAQLSEVKQLLSTLLRR
jgi:tetratricopeptide (TPR) repeat protein